MVLFLTFHGSIAHAVAAAVPGTRAELGPLGELANLDLARDVTTPRRLGHAPYLVDTELLRYLVVPVHAPRNCKHNQPTTIQSGSMFGNEQDTQTGCFSLKPMLDRCLSLTSRIPVLPVYSGNTRPAHIHVHTHSSPFHTPSQP